jgi:hypothetical protein
MNQDAHEVIKHVGLSDEIFAEMAVSVLCLFHILILTAIEARNRALLPDPRQQPFEPKTLC